MMLSQKKYVLLQSKTNKLSQRYDYKRETACPKGSDEERED